MPSVLIPLADGVEEMEAVTIIDILRRAEWEVTTAGIAASTITASRGVRLVADALWDALDLASFDILILPGGGDSAKRLAAHSGLRTVIRDFVAAGKIVGAICAAPIVLEAAGVLVGRRATAYPSALPELHSARRSEDRVVFDPPILTSRGPGTAIEFVLALIALVQNKEAANKVAAPMLMPPGII